MNTICSNDSLTGDADLAGIGKSGSNSGSGDLLKIRIVQDNKRAIRAKLHGHSLEASRSTDRLAYLCTASKANFPNTILRANCRANRTA